MSKLLNNEDFQIEPPDKCRHNKIAQNIKKIYHHGQPVRIRTVTHLTRLGLEPAGAICEKANHTKFQCACERGKLQQKDIRVDGKANQGQIKCNWPIFSYIVTTFKERNSDLEAEKKSSAGKHTERVRSPLISKFRENHKKSKNYLAGHKPLTIWLMKPVKAMRSSSTEITTERKDFEENFKNYVKPMGRVWFKYPLHELDNPEAQRLTKTFVKSKLRLHSLCQGYPLSNSSSGTKECVLQREDKTKTMNQDLIYLKKFETVVEFYNAHIQLEDMQYKDA
ncbi:uncharacterized protein LOC106085236 isoform X2 [Stomoxys calcitrans]|uniref:uncharacterized protein LOC106085236 isoform X2 n=1 Tax=Stomoxys calcitrans TaxID=35570 RepID=UPI0027E2371E|nr:uncharacterized protein LOC106085236 isoform X2 [Stomoxys calcitrans]